MFFHVCAGVEPAAGERGNAAGGGAAGGARPAAVAAAAAGSSGRWSHLLGGDALLAGDRAQLSCQNHLKYGNDRAKSLELADSHAIRAATTYQFPPVLAGGASPGADILRREESMSDITFGGDLGGGLGSNSDGSGDTSNYGVAQAMAAMDALQRRGQVGH